MLPEEVQKAVEEVYKIYVDSEESASPEVDFIADLRDWINAKQQIL